MENQNSVCFVARINEVKPIEGADNIELGVIGGWNCIIKKGEYTEGDLVVVATLSLLSRLAGPTTLVVLLIQ